jgi:UDP-GlcNAc:undecaprenyl-phosphate GlcNAc-1-phosphate transferase
MTAATLSWVIAFFGVVSSVWLLRPLAFRIGLVDKPGGRKLHEGEIPLIGGICLFLGFTFALLCLPLSLRSYGSYFAGCTLLVVIGFLDDYQELSVNVKLLSQIIAALLMVLWGNNKISQLGNLLFFGNLSLGLLSIPFTIFAVVGIINAINMTDGVDGLVVSVGLVQILLLTAIAVFAGNFHAVKILCLLIFGLIGFALFNFRFSGKPKIHIFLGDAGSMFLGFSLCWFLISLTQSPLPAARPITMLPIFDTLRLVMKRTFAGHSPFCSGRDHLHHILENRGLCPAQISLFIASLSLIFGLVGLISELLHIAESWMFLSLVMLFISYVYMLNLATKSQTLVLEKTFP